MRIFRVRRGQRGFSAAQTLVGGGMLVVLALGISQLVSNSLKSQRQATLRSTRDQLITYYTGLTRNPSAKANTIAGTEAENAVLRNHTTGTPTIPPGNWNTPATIRPVSFHDASNQVAVPATGLFLMENGQPCPDTAAPGTGGSCPVDKATWKVDVQWIAHVGTEYEMRAVINQVKKVEGDIALKEYSFRSMDQAAESYWQHGSDDNIYKMNGKVGIGTDNPLQNLHVHGTTRFSTSDVSRYYMDIAPIERVSGDVYYDFMVKDFEGLQDVAALSIRGQDGYVGIGEANPTANLHVSGEGDSTELRVTNTTSDKTLLLLADKDGNVFLQEQSTDANAIWLAPNGNVGIGITNGTAPTAKLYVQGGISASGPVQANGVVLTSDGRLKRDVRALEDSLALILRLRGVSYAWTPEAQRERNLGAGREIGLVAQEVEKVYPELVATDADGVKSVDYIRLVAPLIEAVKAQELELTREREARRALEARLRKLEARAKRIE